MGGKERGGCEGSRGKEKGAEKRRKEGRKGEEETLSVTSKLRVPVGLGPLVM